MIPANFIPTFDDQPKTVFQAKRPSFALGRRKVWNMTRLQKITKGELLKMKANFGFFSIEILIL